MAALCLRINSTCFHVHMYGEYIILLKPLHPVVVMCDVSATLILDNTKVGQTEWKLPSNHAWDQVFMIDLDKVSEVPHCFTMQVLV